jgi:hypothetical protein
MVSHYLAVRDGATTIVRSGLIAPACFDPSEPASKMTSGFPAFSRCCV